VYLPWRIVFLRLCLIFLAVFIRGRQTTIVSNCLAQGLIDGKLKELLWLFCSENQCFMGLMGFPIGVDNPYSACVSIDFS
jgi:hypothetical protein